jgi:hypothetical protein
MQLDAINRLKQGESEKTPSAKITDQETPLSPSVKCFRKEAVVCRFWLNDDPSEEKIEEEKVYNLEILTDNDFSEKYNS